MRPHYDAVFGPKQHSTSVRLIINIFLLLSSVSALRQTAVGHIESIPLHRFQRRSRKSISCDFHKRCRGGRPHNLRCIGVLHPPALTSSDPSSRSLEHGLKKIDDLPCAAPISRLRVEKIEGGLVVAGVVVAANCQVALPIFGCLFILVGIVLTVASYRGPAQDEAPENYAARLAFTGNSRILGPACIVVGFLMLSAGIALCLLTKRARKREKRVGFHCPIHGDFYPLSPVTASKALGKYDTGWGLCFGRVRNGMDRMPRTPPQCPHTQMSSTRSSFSSVPVSPCPTPVPFLFASNSISSDMANSVGANVSPDQTFGSIRSLSVTREVASFPLSRTPSPPSPQTRSYSRCGSVTERNYKVFQREQQNSESNKSYNNNDDSSKSENGNDSNYNSFCKSNGEQDFDGVSSAQFPEPDPPPTETPLLESTETDCGQDTSSSHIWVPQLSKTYTKSVSIAAPTEETR